MWSVRRLAALQQLSRAGVVRHGPLLRPVAAPASGHSLVDTRSFATNSLAGIDIKKLVDSSSGKLQSELRRAKLAEVHRALSRQFVLTVGKPNVAVDELKELFAAADKTRLDSLLLRSFEHIKQHHPSEIDGAMYKAVFRVLSRQRGSKRICEVFEFARSHFADDVPEFLYEHGIVGYLEQGNVTTAWELVQEMENNGVPVNNDIYSRLLAGYARKKDGESALALYERLDLGEGQWRQSSVDRIILSLGVLGKPALAFEFYVNSKMKLNGGTLITLLSVCRHNDCKQQATDILQNRKRYNMKLDGRAYNAILETMEFLEQTDEIKAVLAEMKASGVAFDAKTKAIVARNQDSLKGTAFGVGTKPQPPQVSKVEGIKKEVVADHNPDWLARQPLLQLLREKKYDEAIQFASTHVRPVTQDDLDPESPREIPAGALLATPSMAKTIVSAYLSVGDHALVARLLDGFSVIRGEVHGPLNEIVKFHSQRIKSEQQVSDKDAYATAYRAAKLLVEMGRTTPNNYGALRFFTLFEDADAVRCLCERVVQEHLADVHEPAATGSRGPRHSSKQAATLLSMAARFFGDTNRVEEALALFDAVHESGWKLETSVYQMLLQGMRPHVAYGGQPETQVEEKPFVYTSEDVVRVLDHLEAHGLSVNRTAIIREL